MRVKRIGGDVFFGVISQYYYRCWKIMQVEWLIFYIWFAELLLDGVEIMKWQITPEISEEPL
jgi:hypothetical protein